MLLSSVEEIELDRRVLVQDAWLRTVAAVINTLSGDTSVMRDGFYIRRAAVERQIPCFTSLDTARAAVESLLMEGGNYSVKCTKEYRNGV